MSSSALAAGLRHLRGQLAAQQRRDDSDEQLLHAFLSCRDDNAFAVLVRRHGPMVLQVCRRVLGHEQDAEDAFQATFLVLARNAGALRKQTSLASFLYGIAYRTAMKAKRSAALRRKYEGYLRALTQPRSSDDPADVLSWQEVRALLDEEIARLPEMYRSVFVLFHLEDLSREEIARRLGLKDAAVAKRLAKARKRLAQRLSRRGVELTAALAATAVATPPTSAIPAELMASTVEAASAAAAGEGLSGIVSASVAELVQGATAAMMLSKAKLATVMLLAVSLLAGAGAWGYRGLAANALLPSVQSVEPSAIKPEDKPQTPAPERETTKTVAIRGRVLDPDGKPKVGAKLLLLGKEERLRQLGTTTADGRFAVSVPKEIDDSRLIAQAENFGIDFVNFSLIDPKEPVELRLVKDREIRGRIVNTEGKPVAGALLTVKNVGIGDNKSLDSFLTQWKKKFYGVAIPGGIQLMVRLDDSRHERAALFAAMTDAEGRFAFRGLGEERFVWLRLSGGGIAAKNLWIINRTAFDPGPYNQAPRDRVPKGFELRAASEMLRGSDLSVITEAEKVILGMVKDADSGKGMPNVIVHLSHAANRGVEVPLQATTDSEGRYQIRGAHKAHSYTLEVAEDAALGYMPSRFEAADTPGYQPVHADIKVKKGVIISGKMIDRSTGKPLRGFVRSAILVGNPFAKDFPAFNLSGWFLRQNTDASGNFRVVAIPGPVLLMGGPRDFEASFYFKPPAPDPKYPHFFDTSTLGADFPSFIDSHSAIIPIQGNFCKVLEIKADAKVVKQDIVLERASVLPVQICDSDGKPLPGVWVAGISAQGGPAIRCEKAECSAYQIEPGKPRLLVFFHPTRKLAGTLTLKGDEKAPVAAKLGPAGAIKGRLLDADSKPLAGVVVDVQYRQRAASALHNNVHRAKQIVTDTDGMFTLDELIPALKFEPSFRHGKQRFERQIKPGDAALEVEPGECRDLGAIKLKRVPARAGE